MSARMRARRGARHEDYARRYGCPPSCRVAVHDEFFRAWAEARDALADHAGIPRRHVDAPTYRGRGA